jgi:SAM-dependent methyltransferase
MDKTCVICTSTDTTDIMFRQGIYKCNACGCLFRTNTFDYSWYEEVDYWYKGVEELKLYQRSMIAWFSDYIQDGPSIEFGAADGDFCAELTKYVDAENITYSELVPMLRSEYTDKGFSQYIGSFDDYPEDLIKFKNIFMIDVLEHINDPVKALSKAHDLLQDDGRFFMVTNNGDALNAHDEIFRHQEHMVILTKAAVQIMAHDCGFKILRYFLNPQGLSFTIMEKAW